MLDISGKPLAFPDFDMNTRVFSAQNGSITLHFKAIAYPAPEFHWFKLNDSSWSSLKYGNKYETKAIDNYSYLIVRNITENDYGRYKLIIQNDVGSLEQLYFLKENGKYMIIVSVLCSGLLAV